ncbi:MAG: hypothetical protein FWB74_03765 [Defluviitaleaceae bacterium]|nr:hypothetical protein [Defluviitaleaceae bacterium]
MDVNTNYNLISAANAANQNQPVAAVPTAAQQQGGGLIGNVTVPQDILDLSGSRPRSEVNMNDINTILAQHNERVESFRVMIQSLLNRQAHTATMGTWNGTATMMIEIDEETRAQAERDIAEDGYFGVAQTSERILSFARAFAGDDEGRINIMRDAFLAGFRAAEQAWGGNLPEISQQTFDAVMRGFDEMLGIAPSDA